MPWNTFYPLGYPVELEVRGDQRGASEVYQSARDHWGACEPRFEGRPLRIGVEVDPLQRRRTSSLQSTSRPRLAVRRWGFEMHWNHGARARFDSRLRCGALELDAVPRIGQHLLETLVWSALDSMYFTPLHAACVARDGRAVLLCGDSGAGKSCLTYACARRGWTLISDDAVHLGRSVEPLLAGGSHTIRLRPAARALFPELVDWPASCAHNGKMAIDLGFHAQQFDLARFGTPVKIAFLSRRTGTPSVSEFPGAAALAYFTKYLWQFDTAWHLLQIDRLLRMGAHRLAYEQAGDAVDVLERMVMQ